MKHYSGLEEYENIDLLFFYQWESSRLKDDNVYKKLENYSELKKQLVTEFGDEAAIKGSSKRYINKNKLIELLKSKKLGWFNEKNFSELIELFSNNQILYKFVRCDAVHNGDSVLFNKGREVDSGKSFYEDNHQIDRKLIISTVRNIKENLRDQCLKADAFPWEL